MKVHWFVPFAVGWIAGVVVWPKVKGKIGAKA
jgi:hypothetical protein